MKVGVALGGGGAKGFAHIAVLEKIKRVDCLAGSSIGALVAAMYSYGCLEEFKEDMLSLNRTKLVRLLDPKIGSLGFINGKKIIRYLTKFIPANARIENLKIPLAIVATEYNTGKAVVFRRGNLAMALRASCSIPGVFIPVKYKNTYLIDGSMTDPLPVDILRKMGAKKIIAVNLTEQFDYELETSQSSSRIKFVKLTDRKAPNVLDIIMKISELYRHRMSIDVARVKAVKEIRPDVSKIGILDFHRAKEAYEAGKRSAALL